MGLSATVLLFGVVCLLAPGALAWPHGSVATCPAGPEPVCTNPTQYDEKLPHPTDCHYWIHCDAGGLPVCKICPANLHFNNVTKNCDYPENAGCASGGTAPPTTSAPLPTSAPTTTVVTYAPTTAAPTDPECPSDSGQCPKCVCGSKISHYECSFYYKCEKGYYKLNKCPIVDNTQLFFNPVLGTCDYPCNVDCSGGTTPGPSDPSNPSNPSTTPSPIPSTSAPLPVNCPSGSPSGTCPNPATVGVEVYFPHPRSCGHFFQCSNGTPVCMPCPAGLHWNQAASICDWPSNAKCSSSA